MNRRSAVSFVLLLGSTVLAAQATVPLKETPTQATVIQVTPQPGSCPISIRAQQMPGPDRVEVNGVPLTGMAQKLHIIVGARNSNRVVAVNLTVRGFANKGRVLQTMSTQDNSDAARTLDVRFHDGPGREVSSDLRVPGLSGVTVIDLNSVTYSDGSTWGLAAGGSCRTWIDGLMLVSNR